MRKQRASDLLTTGEAARELQVSVATIRRWERRGALAATRTPGNQRRFYRADIEALLNGATHNDEDEEEPTP